MPSVLIGPVLMIGFGFALLAGFFTWMWWTLGWAAEKRRVLAVRRHSALERRRAPRVLDGVVIPKRKAIEP